MYYNFLRMHVQLSTFLFLFNATVYFIIRKLRNKKKYPIYNSTFLFLFNATCVGHNPKAATSYV